MNRNKTTNTAGAKNESQIWSVMVFIVVLGIVAIAGAILYFFISEGILPLWNRCLGSGHLIFGATFMSAYIIRAWKEEMGIQKWGFRK